MRQRIADDAVPTRRQVEHAETERRSLHLRLQRPAAHLPQVPFELDLEVRAHCASRKASRRPASAAKLYLWSGNTTPFEGAIRATRAAGVRNLNGGDSRFDQDYPSVIYVPPIGREIGAERQIYAVNSNENTYTNDWTGPYFGFFMLQQTLDNTEKPRRLKPFNLYYHMYSGEKPAALRLHPALPRHGAQQRPSSPSPPPHYAGDRRRLLRRRDRAGSLSSWSVARRGELDTVRFDEARDLTVDIDASQGVLGFNRHEGSIYVDARPRG